MPWGTVADSIPQGDDFDLDQIVANGEVIALTVSGPETYYDYRGRHLGTQYLLCQRFAEHIGVRLRVEVCRDSAEAARRLAEGDGDIALVSTSQNSQEVPWTVGPDKPRLAAAVKEWYKPGLIAEVKKQETFLLSAQSIQRRVFSPMLNRAGGVISHYDGLFVRYARQIRWDWRLLAAQCYQESTFDPQAKSWAGACGLMQIMPATAQHLNLPLDNIYDPEANIAAAVRYIGELENSLAEIADRQERINFTLASYNGGLHHIRDAMALTRKNGGNPHRWAEVQKYVLLLSQPQYYNDPVVKSGYMRGSETADYVQRIRQRWAGYRGVKTPRTGFTAATPQKATHAKKRKYQVE